MLTNSSQACQLQQTIRKGPCYSSVDLTLGNVRLAASRGTRQKRENRRARQFLEHFSPDKLRTLHEQQANDRHLQRKRNHRHARPSRRRTFGQGLTALAGRVI
jgi:hypothetical protein